MIPTPTLSIITVMMQTMLSEGTSAPDFTLPGIGAAAETFREYQLSEYTAEGAVVLLFYPADYSPVCTTQLCELRDAEWLSVTESIDVLAISQDSCYAHQQFSKDHHLSFPLLSDTTGEVTRAYDVDYDVWELQDGLPKRSVFIIDDAQTIQYAWVSDDAYVAPEIDDLHDAVQEIVSVDVPRS
jgi:peroxiredoxin